MDKYLEKFYSYSSRIRLFLSEDKSQRFSFGLLFMVFSAIIFILNKTYPLYADDWGYTFVSGSELTKRITGLGDIYQSQYSHYFDHGGRVVVHCIAEFLLLIGGIGSDLLNSMGYILFVLVIYKIANLQNKTSASLFFIINMLIWFFQPAFAQTILWITGSANYLWGGLIILSFLYIYVKGFLTPGGRNSTLKAVVLFPGGIIAGWTNENTAFGMIIIIVLIIAFMKVRREKIPLWMLTGLAGAIVGYILMVAAPGNFVRYEESIAVNSMTEVSKLKFYLSRLLPVVGDFYKFALSLVFIYFVALSTYLYFEPKKDVRVICLSALFFIGGITADLVMIASPEFPPRAWFGIITFFIVAICILYANIRIDNTYLFTIKVLICVFAGIYFMLSLQRGYKDLYKINRVFEERERIIAEQPDKANFDFVTHETINPQTGFPMIDEVPSDSSHWINMFYVRYHNIKSFTIEKE